MFDCKTVCAEIALKSQIIGSSTELGSISNWLSHVQADKIVTGKLDVYVTVGNSVKKTVNSI